ncbi:hypothetical protein POTOM_013620 [Populus tomentosa]|uniref:Uncharacterized protein n=1 Tax=Populus tomentosa TaxID=118781 RepID=A0A8X8A668_POPTO|nr:hypothetical protein POTOM_013620 [Populus tomentosa]
MDLINNLAEIFTPFLLAILMTVVFLSFFSHSWVLLESLQFFCVNYTVKLLDIDATQGSGPAAQHPWRKATFLLATIVLIAGLGEEFRFDSLRSYWTPLAFYIFQGKNPKNTAIDLISTVIKYLLCFPGHFASSIQKSPCTRDSDMLCVVSRALSLMNQPGAEEVVKDSTSCSRWKEDEKECLLPTPTMWAIVLLDEHPEYFNHAKEHRPKSGSDIPFGIGSRLCPGGDLDNLEISVFLHCLLLNYK